MIEVADIYCRNISQLQLGQGFMTKEFEGPFIMIDRRAARNGGSLVALHVIRKTPVKFHDRNERILPVELEHGRWIQPESGWEINF